ncbi:hypothetical protein F5Y14DRAFT_253581 [Nemania sp. NC0429]|nr:hypothetical protein F5Y14DRAFT_253581 [Nemania sp. NC0429]
MAGLSMLGGELLSERMRELKEELARLRAYQVLAEYNLKQMGVSLEDAERQGWVSKRAEVRRKRQERKKAAENAKWAKVKRDREWIRKQRKEVGLPVEDPTPTPSETAYKQRVEEAAREETEERLRNRVRRVSHQLLIAAAIGKQYRELTVADHSGSVVPGGDQAVRLQYSPLDARSETSLTTTAAMARSFRNWVNRERAKHVRYRSDTPEPVVQENRAPVPEMLGGSGGDDSPADDGASGIAGPTALRAIIHDAALTDEDGSDLDEDDDFGGLTGLDATEVSDEVMATAYSMLTTAESIDHGRGHWADILADDVLQFLMYDQPATSPSAAEFSVFPTSGSGSDAGHSDAQSDLSDEVNAAAVRPLQKEANQKRNIWGGIEPDDILDPRGGAEEVHYQEQSHGQTRTNYPPEVEAALIFLKQQRTPERSPAPDSRRPKDGNLKQQQAPYRSPILVPPSPKDGNPGDNKAPSHKASSYRKPNKPATPHRSVWDPTFWRINTKDPDDGVWAGKPAAHRQPKDETETGFITWAEQEEKFPRLDARLGLSRVRGSRSMFFDTSTFDTQIWDPLSRSVMEPRTGTRVPLHLNPVTIHSLALWTMDRYGSEFSLDPIQLPDNPPNEEKKRHMQPTTTLSQPPQGVAKSTGRGLRKVSFAEEAKTFAEEDAKMQMSTKGEPGESTDEPPPEIVASIHYPLRSPAATSISRPQTQTREGQHDNAGPRTPNTRFATSFANIRPSLPGPPTPYPRAMPDTPSVPTVSLYEGGAASWNGDAAMPIVVEEEEEAEEGKGGEEEKADEEGEAAKEDEDKRLVAYLQKLHTAPGGPNKIKHGLTELELDSLASPSTRPVALMQRPHTAGGGGDRRKRVTPRRMSNSCIHRHPSGGRRILLRTMSRYRYPSPVPPTLRRLRRHRMVRGTMLWWLILLRAKSRVVRAMATAHS